jgi:hypothetical protein
MAYADQTDGDWRVGAIETVKVSDKPKNILNVR